MVRSAARAFGDAWCSIDSNFGVSFTMVVRVASERSFLDLDVWQRAMDLMVACYRLTSRLPAHERFGICSQLQRASLSVATNIAEGNGRRTKGEYLNALSNAQGSLNEVHTLLIAILRLEYCTREDLREHGRLLQRIGRMLAKLRTSLGRK